MHKLGGIALAAAILVVGCGNRETPPPPPETPVVPPTGPENNGTEPPGPDPNTAAPATVGDATFELQAAPAAAGYRAGQAANFSITLTPKGIYHVNEEYPIAIRLAAQSGVALTKPSLARADAAEFTTRVARFDVPFTPASAGTHRVVADVDFAVCTPEACMPDTRTVALALVVQ